VVFATPGGEPSEGDDLMVSGRGLDPWGQIPLLRNVVVVGRVLRADARGRAAYTQLVASPAFGAPLSWAAAAGHHFDGLVLPGGHRARGMRQYLESGQLQHMVVDCFGRGIPVGAICHGVLLAARSIDPATGHSVLYGRQTTALTWQLERTAWALARRTRFWDPDYYRTYPDHPGQPTGFMSVQHEVTRALERPGHFRDVDLGVPDRRRKTSGRSRDTPADDTPAWVVRDGNYVSARWPGDVHAFARTFVDLLAEAPHMPTAVTP